MEDRVDSMLRCRVCLGVADTYMPLAVGGMGLGKYWLDACICESCANPRDLCAMNKYRMSKYAFNAKKKRLAVERAINRLRYGDE